MNLNLFKTYIKVVETQNLSRTAEFLGISQPAVTKQIQAIEEAYGVLLLERTGRKLRPTAAGEILYNHAREIIKATERAEQAMHEMVIGNKDYLALGASTIPGQYILPAIIKDFKDAFPSIDISLEIADTEKIFAHITDRKLDLGVVGGWLNKRGIDGFQWLEDELVLIVPEKHRLAANSECDISELLDEKWIFREKGSGTRKAVEELMESQAVQKKELNVCMEAGSTEAVMAMVESGMGISIVSSWVINRKDLQQHFKFLRLKGTSTHRYFYVIYPRQKVRRPVVKQFIEYLQSIGTGKK